MWIGNMHVNIVQGDFVFPAWEKGSLKKYNKKVHELRVAGYRKIDQEHDCLNYYEYYRRKGKKKVVTVTIMCC